MYRSLGDDIAHLRRLAGTSESGIGVVGFSIGGHWPVWLSQRPEYHVQSTILCYAARGGDFSGCKSPFQVHFAEQDDWVNKRARQTMKTALGKGGCACREFDYPNTTHWFAEASRPADFAPNASSLALERDIRHLGRSLRPATDRLHR